MKLNSALYNFPACSTFISHVTLPYVRQFLHNSLLAYTAATY